MKLNLNGGHLKKHETISYNRMQIVDNNTFTWSTFSKARPYDRGNGQEYSNSIGSEPSSFVTSPAMRSLSRLPRLFHAWRAVLLSFRMSKSQLRLALRWWLSLVRQAATPVVLRISSKMFFIYRGDKQNITNILRSIQVVF